MIYFSCPKLKKIKSLSHGFFTRQGGVSHGVYNSLNVGVGSDDNADHVFTNLKRIRNTLEADSLLTVYQVHSNRVVVANKNTKKVKCDAMVTTTPELAIGILTADCVPVLFADDRNRVIGAAHAGWKGALTGIIANTVNTMIEQGAERSNITASIGPCIGKKSYEVGSEFKDRFVVDDVQNDAFFKTSKKAEHYMFDISRYVESRLAAENLATVHVVNHDTYKEENLFFSFRRATHKSETDYGRQMSAICLKKN